KIFAAAPAEKPEVAAPATAQPMAAQPAATLARSPLSGSTDPISPVRVKTITVKAGNVQTASLYPLVAPAPQATVAPPHFAKNAVVMEPTAAPPGSRPGVLGVLPAEAPAPAVYEIASAASVPATTGSMS